MGFKPLYPLLRHFIRVPPAKRTPTGDSISSPYLVLFNTKKQAKISISQTQLLTERNGRAPEQTVAKYAGKMLEDAGFNTYIEFNHDSINLELPTIGEWSEYLNRKETLNSEKLIMKDANLLLVNRDGGGASYLNGKFGVMGANNIDRVLKHKWTGERSEDRNVHGALHEILHMLHAGHDEDEIEPGDQYPGDAWETLRYWHRTPMAGGDEYNACDEEIDDRPSRVRVVRHQRMSDCTKKFIKIE